MGGLLAQIKQGKQLKKVGPENSHTSPPSRPKDISSQLDAMFAGKSKSASLPGVSDAHKESEVWQMFIPFLHSVIKIRMEFH
jgi:hypothetical protein